MEKTASGWVNGMVGMCIFAGSLPATRVAITGFEPWFLTSARATSAALVGFLLLLLLKQPKPQRTDLPSLVLSALGCVLGFPLLTALALQFISSAHSIVFLGLLPLCTAIFAVIRGGEKPLFPFWLFSIIGASVVVGYAALNGGGGSLKGNMFMLAAVLVCGLGYAEGAIASRRLGGWQVISWSLVISLPVMMPLMWWTWPSSFTHVMFSAWVGLAYVSLFSMLIGFMFWYRGLAQGGIAAVGQLQLLQPFLGFGLAALFLKEQVSGSMLIVTFIAVFCVAGARKFA